MTLLFKLLNNNLDNDLVFYGLFIGVVGGIGYSFASKILRKSYMEKGVQTDAGENYEPSLITPENVTSIDTLSPVSSTFEDTSTLIPTTSEVGTQTITKDVTSEVGTQTGDMTSEVGTQTITGDMTPVNIPNQNIAGRVVDISNAEYLAAKVEQLNALDPFSANLWTPDRVSAMIDQLGIVNNLFN